MAILRFLLRSAGPMAIVMGVLSFASGAFNAGLVAIVHRVLVAGASSWLLYAFLGLGLGKVVCAYVSGLLVTAQSQESITELRRELISKVLAFPYARFEQLGRERVYTALTEDIGTVNAAFQSLPGFIVNIAIVAGGSAYLLYLSVPTFLALAVLAAISGSAYRLVGKSARGHLKEARKEHERLFGHFRSLTEGTKELKQHAGRRQAFLDAEVLETTEALMEQYIAGHGRYQLGQAASSLTSLAALALILFIMPKLSGTDAAAMSGYVLTSLYLMGPMGGVLRMLPLLAAADIAHRRIQDLGIALGEDAREPQAKPGDRERFRSIRLHDVVHTYRSEKSGAPFQLGPISLELHPAQVLFVTGENGSGKSTLAKVLIGLYEPEAGEVTWNSLPVNDQNRDSYRQLFTVVHSDHFLFTSLLGLEHENLDERATQLLSRLQLEERVTVEGGRLSTLRLSQGQKKRLALLTAYLEDRPIFVFDEWAADQDPEFKEVFYRELLPELRARGKAVVVITHDDRYFGLSDRRLHLKRGQATPEPDPG